MYAKILEFMVDSINIYGNIFGQVDPLPWITILKKLGAVGLW